MIKFLRLIEVINHQCQNVIIIPADEIKLITISEKGVDTYIKMKCEAKPYFVKETMDQIWLMLNTDMTKSPVMMNAEEALEYEKINNSDLYIDWKKKSGL